MNNSLPLRSIYLYLVCFVTLLMIVFGLISFFHNLARLAFPVEYAYRQTLMDVEQELSRQGQSVPSAEELETIRETRYTNELERSRALMLRNLIGSFTFWLIPVPFYIVHWRKVKDELLTDGGDPA